MSEQPLVDDMQYDGNAIQHDSTLDDMLGDVHFTQDSEPLADDTAYDEFLRSEAPTLDEPIDTSLLDAKKRTPTAKKYERKVAGVFSIGVKVTATQEHLLADSAALLLYGPDISQKMGDLAAANPRVARAIDMITDQTENPATAVIMASLPLVLQVVRNHEPRVENDKRVRTFKIPFTKRRLRFKVGFKLNKRMRNFTQDPVLLQRHVFLNPAIQEALAKQGIIVSVSE